MEYERKDLVMVQHLIKLIDEIKVKENNVLIVLKGFDNNIFKTLSPIK